MPQSTTEAQVMGGPESGILDPYQMRPYLYNNQAYVAVNGTTPRPVHNALLRKDEWEQLDEALVTVGQDRIPGVNDLFNAGLTHNLRDLGVTISQYESVSKMDAAQESMSGTNLPDNDRVDFTLRSVPVPIVHKYFTLQMRTLMSSRQRGEPLDTTQAEASVVKIQEKNEDILFNGGSITVDGNSIAGYTTTSGNATGNVTADWTDSSGTDPVGDVTQMIEDNKSRGFFGPYVLYVNTAYSPVLDEDYKAESERTLRQRLESIPDIQAVRVTTGLDSSDGSGGHEICLVEMSRMTVDMATIQRMPITVQWESQGGWINHFMPYTSFAPRIKLNDNGETGVVLYDDP